MPDIRTMETIDVGGEYRVVVSKDHDRFQAAVTGIYVDLPPIPTAFTEVLGMEANGWNNAKGAPRVLADGKYEAVGKAIDQYERKKELEKQDKEEDNE